MSKADLLKYLDNPSLSTARNSMGCSENWYNPFYAMMETFTREEIEAMTEQEVSNLLKLANRIGDGLY